MQVEPKESGIRSQSSKSQNLSEFSGSRAASPPLLQLQASPVANGVVQRVDLLNAAQVTSAKAFFSGRSSDFTVGIIKKIQTQVGVAPASGTMTDATVQGIATFQKTNGLTVNGTLDSLTIPMFFPHGLTTDKAQTDYAADFDGIDWTKLTTANEKAGALVKAANTQLIAAGVPAIGVALKSGLGTASGNFNFPTWDMNLDQTLFARAVIPQATLDKVANYVIHESRHAEQWFNMAQLLAGQGKTDTQIAAKMGIPKRIATKAVADPIAAGTTKALVVDGWYQSVYGSGSASRNTIITNVVADASPANYAPYKALPEESDAFQVGDGFSEKLAAKRKTP